MNIKKILLIMAGVISIVGIVDIYNQNKNPGLVKAYGNLMVDFHSVLPGNTIFDITNFLPGQSVDRNVDVKNEGNTSEVLVKGVKKSPNTSPNLEDALDITIKQGAVTLYSKKLKNFLNDDKVSLGTINKNQTKTFNFKVTFNADAGNQYQGKSLKFDLDFSSAGEVKGDHDEHHPTPKPTPTPRHDDHDRDDHKRDFRDDLKDFGEKCKSAIEDLFKGGKR